MKCVEIKQVDSRAACVEVSECEDIPIHHPYVMHPTGMLRPARVDLRWENGELVRLSVSGPRIKKDGTAGLADATTHFTWHGNPVQETRPDWLCLLVGAYWPVATS